MQNVEVTDHVARRKLAGRENATYEIAGPEIATENAGHKHSRFVKNVVDLALLRWQTLRRRVLPPIAKSSSPLRC